MGGGCGSGHKPGGSRTYFSARLRKHQEHPELMCLWIELAAASRPDHLAHSYFVDRQAHGLAHLTEGLREYAERGRLRKGINPTTERAKAAQAADHGACLTSRAAPSCRAHGRGPQKNSRSEISARVPAPKGPSERS